ncbi:dTDP-4-dehydrorhamnose 3,5-epimerase [Limibaculum sp. M0105]|uniref:dTDP-4-dehydrorhamnose 3,5-epimerase n=1 Tax=Thermohalobaculum xanthum TaxID=2753746 RepID=A0A8J7M728_9RHOB|nr:dTDP-4-dehydrorhamnose 3,5-epimerase [Thermohalobaculum xanthum]MBK0398910.1 dTDP-4-dehydrorhamnose 3,5-epimerase [Thermohalobaculum xanthum]
MRLIPQAIPDVLLVEGEPAGDARGWFARLWCAETFAAAGVDFRPSQISQSMNAEAGTLRGLHFQHAPHAEAKLVRCLRGRAWDVAVDLREDSPTRHRWVGVELSPGGRRAVLIPRGFAHGFITLEPGTELLYITDHPWTPGAEGGLRWDDPALAIDWPAEPRVLSDRDRGHPLIGAGDAK